METIPTLFLDIWIDYICPFSYMQLPVIEQFQQVYGPAVAVRWHPFELRPEPMPLPPDDAPERIEAWARTVYPTAAERGVSLRMPPVMPRSRLAFETAHFAGAVGRFDEVHRALFDAFFQDGANLGEVDTLIRIAASCGVDAEGLREALELGRYTDIVLEHQALARQVGVEGLPYMMLSRPRGAEGPSQPPIVLRGVAPLQHFHAAVKRLFPEGYRASKIRIVENLP
jgi:predicted DsbA family dithiol-disulfide isomerase